MWVKSDREAEKEICQTADEYWLSFQIPHIPNCKAGRMGDCRDRGRHKTHKSDLILRQHLVQMESSHPCKHSDPGMKRDRSASFHVNPSYSNLVAKIETL
jgi:hypothetical protein